MPVAASVDLAQAGAMMKNLGDSLRSGAILGLHSAAYHGLNEILTRIIPSRSPQPVDRGLYRAGWRVVTYSDGADIENNEPHAAFIEFGVRAQNVRIGRKMIEALTEWVVRKGLATPADAVQRAWAIARSMQKRGIFYQGTGMNILGELLEWRMERFVEEEVIREVEAML